MPRYLILAQSAVTGRVLDAWREFAGCRALLGEGSCPEPILYDSSRADGEAGSLAYESIADRLEAAARGDGPAIRLNDVVVLVDSVRPQSLTAVTEGTSWDHLLALLVLSFPEIKWIFGVVIGGWEESLLAEHTLPALLNKSRRDPLLDPTGLRNWIRRRTNKTLASATHHGEQAFFELPLRCAMAASIDEEKVYAYYHAYAAYRYGFRADVVTSWVLMRALYEKESGRTAHEYALLLEDMRLNFSDKPMDVHLSRLRLHTDERGRSNGRAEHCPLLDQGRDTSQWRFLITTGQMGGEEDLVRDNEEYLREKAVGRGEVLYKPVGGLSDVWEKTGLSSELGGSDRRAGNADGFDWPPQLHAAGEGSGHGAPGKLILIAERLLRRAEGLRTGGGTAQDFIQGAVLALEATELLAGRTPTMTLGAIVLKHDLEVRAECAFLGAGYHIGTRRRVEELDDELSAITQWFHPDARRKARLDATVSTLNRLALTFREAGQTEEELACVVALRAANRSLSRPVGQSRLNPLAWMTHGLLAYAEWLLTSFDRVILLTVFWLVLLTGAAWWLGSGTPTRAASHAIGWFFGGSPANSRTSSAINFLSWFGVAAGVFHIGVLISYLYSLISRK